VRRTALRIGVSFVVPLAIAVALGHPREGALATQGAFVALYARDEPYRRRLRVMGAVGLALVAVVVLGTLTSTHSGAAVAVGAGLVAGVGALACQAWNVDRPREFILVLAFLAATQYPGGAGEVPLRAALVLGGAAVVTAIAMASALRRPRAPEEEALQRFWTRLAALLDAMGGPRVGEARHALLVAAEHARSVMTRAGHRRGDGDRLFGIALAGEAVTDAALGLVLRDAGPLDPAWAAAARTLERAVRDPAAAQGLRLPDAAPDTIHGPRFRRTMAAAVAATDARPAPQSTIVPFGRRRRRGPWAAVRRAVHPGSLVLPTAVRTGIAVAVGTAIGLLLDEQRGIWVGLTTAAVLQATNVTLTARRTVQRALGTIVGVVVAAGIFALDPAAGTIVVALAVCQTLMQSTLFTAYGVATVFATPIALLIVDLGVPGVPASSLVGARIVDTLLGCAVGLLARRFLWPQTAATRLGVAQGATIEAVRDVLHAALTRAEAPSGDLVRRSRRALHTALLNLQAVQQDAVGDLLLSSRAADDRWTITTAVSRLAYAAMGFAAPADRPSPARERLQELDAALGALAAMAEGHRARSLVAIPDLGAHPATHRAIVELRDVLAGKDDDVRRSAAGRPPTVDAGPSAGSRVRR
jgi:uncharacterized membrane protein YccC